MTWHCLGRTMISEPPCGSPAPEDLRKSEAIEVRFIVEDTKGNQYRSEPMSLFLHSAQTGTLALITTRSPSSSPPASAPPAPAATQLSRALRPSWFGCGLSFTV